MCIVRFCGEERKTRRKNERGEGLRTTCGTSPARHTSAASYRQLSSSASSDNPELGSFVSIIIISIMYLVIFIIFVILQIVLGSSLTEIDLSDFFCLSLRKLCFLLCSLWHIVRRITTVHSHIWEDDIYLASAKYVCTSLENILFPPRE